MDHQTSKPEPAQTTHNELEAVQRAVTVLAERHLPAAQRAALTCRLEVEQAHGAMLESELQTRHELIRLKAGPLVEVAGELELSGTITEDLRRAIILAREDARRTLNELRQKEGVN